ncbi:glycerophosphodiester phosphodiesterase family protein [Enterococcus sp. LJL98]
MKTNIHRTLDLILNNFQRLIVLQIINQLIGIFFIYPITSKILTIAYQYQGKITLSKVQGFEFSLENVLLFSVVFLILGFYSIFLLSSSLVIANDFIQNKKPTLSKQLQTFFQVIRHHSKKELLKTSFAVAVVIPMSLLALLHSAIIPLHIPEFVLDAFRYSKYFNLAAIAFFFFINLYALFLLFVLYDVFLQNKTFEAAHRTNFRFLKEKARTIRTKLLGIFLTASLLFAIYFVSTFALGFVLKQFLSPVASKLVFNQVHSTLLFLFSAMLAIVSLSLVTLLIVETKRTDLSLGEPKASLGRQLFKVGQYLLLLSLILSGLFAMNQKVQLETNDIEIVGHRVGILDLPENSLLALEEAIRQSYDMVEIDVQQLKDEEILVVHDTNFKRLAGSNLKVVDASYEEVLPLDPLYTHPQLDLPAQQFATLDAFAQVAKNQIDLMIEVKTNPQDNDFLAGILAIIEKYQLFDQIQLASMDKGLLKEIKTLNPAIETTYIATALVGDRLSDDYIDHYSLQLDLLTNRVIQRIREQEKKLYVWTPNTSKTITTALDLDVDGIVTDRPELVKFHIQNPNYRRINELWNAFFFRDEATMEYPAFTE